MALPRRSQNACNRLWQRHGRRGTDGNLEPQWLELRRKDRIGDADRNAHHRFLLRAFEEGYYGGSTLQPGAQRVCPGAPAAYQADGIGYDVMGMNVGADGGLTTEIVDGISIDTKGRRTVRLVDGVTLHSDGKTITNITKGADIRSNGQITTEVFGTKASWGGEKEKKKDSWL